MKPPSYSSRGWVLSVMCFGTVFCYHKHKDLGFQDTKCDIWLFQFLLDFAIFIIIYYLCSRVTVNTSVDTAEDGRGKVKEIHPYWFDSCSKEDLFSLQNNYKTSFQFWIDFGWNHKSFWTFSTLQYMHANFQTWVLQATWCNCKRTTNISWMACWQIVVYLNLTRTNWADRVYRELIKFLSFL